MSAGPGAGSVAHIFIARERGAPMLALTKVDAIAASGLEGDRYTRVASRFSRHYQVTLIEMEAIEEFTRDTGLALTPAMPRRNIVTRGVRLSELIGKRFRVGAALLEGAELCEPCSLFARRTHREVVKRLAGKGGLRAIVVESGMIRQGDRVYGDTPVNFPACGASDVRALAPYNNHPTEGT